MSEPQMAALTAIFFDDDDGVTGFIEEFWGVTAHGRDLKEARKRLTETARKFLHENRKDILRRVNTPSTVTREKMLLEI